MTGLQARVGVGFSEFSVDVELSVAPGEVIALLGPNGAGKTTVLRALSGLQPLDSGRIVLDEVVLDDPAADRLVEAADRSVGVVFQDYLLFPHLTVRENVAFGLRARGIAASAARTTADEWLDRVGLASFAGRRPASLSGGQQQRVALARALAYGPRMLLLDEPLAALDAGTRGEVRRDLRAHLDGFDGCTVVVTHDPVDAYALADRVVVVEDGVVVQQGTLAEVAAHPRSRYVADLVGINLLSGVVRGGVFETESETETESGESGESSESRGSVVVGDEPVDGPAFLAIRPQSVSLHWAHPEGSQRNVWQATVAGIDHHHDRVRVRLEGPLPIVAEITPAALTTMHIHQGDRVWAAVKASELVTYPR